jgi:hypothetical protein
MMAAGWDGGPEMPAPGFPDDGTWVVKYEGLKLAQYVKSTIRVRSYKF